MRWLLLVAFALTVAVGCSRKDDRPVPHDTYVYEPIRIASAYIPLVEKPDSARALLLGEEACAISNYLVRAGVKCFTRRDGRFDLIVVACGSMTKASCAKLCESLSERGVVAWLMDVEGVTAEEMLGRFRGFALAEMHLWMPGERRWLLVGRQVPRKVRLSSMLDVFAREGAFDDLAKAKCGSLPELFASYAGTADDVVPAFYNFEKKTLMGPELFTTEKVPEIPWLDVSDVDEDIRRGVLAEIRSMQVMRRVAVKGSIAAAKAKDKKGEEEAAGLFAKAALRNPNDLFVLERLDRLERNAKGFLSLGRILHAMKCYETMVLIRPNDPSAVHNFGMCLKRLGKLDLAEKVLERARTLAKAYGGSASERPSGEDAAPRRSVEGQGARYRNH